MQSATITRVKKQKKSAKKKEILISPMWPFFIGLVVFEEPPLL